MHIIAIVGKTSSGKDTVARFLAKKYEIPMVVSYTTRPKREKETDGVEHYFISEEQMQTILQKEDIIAYTKNEQTGIEYCASLQGMTHDPMIYIINPDGIAWMKENGKGDFTLTTIYVNCPEEIIRQRALQRGDIPEVFEKRLASEREEFDIFARGTDWNYFIQNTKDVAYLEDTVDCIMSQLGIHPVEQDYSRE